VSVCGLVSGYLLCLLVAECNKAYGGVVRRIAEMVIAQGHEGHASHDGPNDKEQINLLAGQVKEPDTKGIADSRMDGRITIRRDTFLLSLAKWQASVFDQNNASISESHFLVNMCFWAAVFIITLIRKHIRW
jgi:hypothetical protein